MDRFAVISDVHGNRWALEAVLEDAERLGLDRIVNLGDVVYGPLDPAGTAALLRPRRIPTVRGNQDRLVTDPGAPPVATLDFVRGELDDEDRDWLRGLPPELVIGDVWLGHGAPGDDTAYLLWDVAADGAARRAPGRVAAALAGVLADHEASLCLTGHDHVPANVPLPDGRRVVNPGSVGLPAYDDDAPHPHVMRAGSPDARYAVVERVDDGWRATHRAVPYDHETAAATAEARGRPDWAAWLRTGWAETPSV